MSGGQTVIMQTDVSDIIRLERIERGRILDDQARLIRATLEHLNQGVCIFDRDRRLVGFNRRLAELLSLPRLRPGLDFDLILRWIGGRLTFPPGVTPETLLRWVTREDPRPPVRFEIRSGESQTLDVFAQEMPDRGFVISFTDVSVERNAARALHEANERLEQRVAERTLDLEDALAAAERANAARTRFVAAASHDLLQPLSAAKLFLSTVAEDPAPARQTEALDKARNALQSVEEIIEALLDISRLESGRAPVALSRIDLDSMLVQLRDEFAAQAALKGLTLRLRPCGLTVESDALYLRRILQNLIGNAIRYTMRGGVVVGVRRSRRSARIEVWDTGPGIPEAEFETIFLEFHRLDSRAGEGLGLGLAIVERACALLGHPIGVDSRLGRGTVFRISVPLALAGPGDAPDLRRSGTAAQPSFPGLVVMLIENDPDLRHALTLLLERWDVEVLELDSGAEGVRLIEETQLAPDAILADFQLDEGAHGTEAVLAIRRVAGALPARIITANRSPQTLAECARCGLEVIHKPIDPAAVAAFLGTVWQPAPRNDWTEGR
jgi:two-component system, sensor histidine kinase